MALPTLSQPSAVFLALLEANRADIDRKTEAFRVFWNKTQRYDVNMDKGELVFTMQDGKRIGLKAQWLGSYNTRAQTWLWVLAQKPENQPCDVAMQLVGSFIQASIEAAKQDGYDLAPEFATPRFHCTPELAENIGKVVLGTISNMIGLYRYQQGNMVVFLGIPWQRSLQPWFPNI